MSEVNEWTKLFVSAMKARSSGNFEHAEALLVQACELAEERFGREDDNTRTAFKSLGELYMEKRKFSEAEAAFRQELSGYESRPDRNASVLDSIRVRLARCLVAQGNINEAQDFDEPWSVYLSGFEFAIAACDLPGAEFFIREAAETVLGDAGIKGDTVCLVVATAVEYYLGLKRFEEAEELAERALERFPPSSSSNAIVSAKLLMLLIKALEGQGRSEEAVEFAVILSRLPRLI